MTTSRFWASLGGADLALLALMAFLLRHTFNNRIGLGDRMFEVSRLVMTIVAWLVIGTPFTICAVILRRFAAR